MTDVANVPTPEGEETEPYEAVDFDARFDPPTDGTFWREWWTPFLRSLASIGIVTDAAKVAGISPRHAQREKQQHEQFALAWKDALDIAADQIRRTVRVRGILGEKLSTTTTTTREELDAEGGVIARVTTVSVTERQEPSNAVLLRLAQAHLPEYKPETTVRHGNIPGEEPQVVEIRDRRRTPERVRDLMEALLELGIEPGSVGSDRPAGSENGSEPA